MNQNMCIITPEVYYSLAENMRDIHLQKLKEQLSFQSEKKLTYFYSDTSDISKSYHHLTPIEIEEATVYRPFNFGDMEKSFHSYIPFILHKHPMGEKKKFQVDEFLYDRLFFFFHGHCAICLEKAQHWTTGDKDVEKMCDACGDETTFVRHWIEY